MKAIRMPFNHIDIGKPSITFTWDDNFTAHFGLIAPQFIKRGLSCTFYINPGEPGFEKYLSGYKSLSENFFEIGSHGFCHDDYTGMPNEKFEYELKRSALSIKDKLGIYPSTFAFPYHAFNDDVLQTARKFFLETRNTLGSSKRFGIRTNSTLDEMFSSVRDCIANGRSLVFTGHSAVPDMDIDFNEDTGHEPVRLSSLSALLDRLQTLQSSSEVLTFEQAAIKQYIIDHCKISDNSCIFSGEQMDQLSAFRIDAEKLRRLI